MIASEHLLVRLEEHAGALSTLPGDLLNQVGVDEAAALFTAQA